MKKLILFAGLLTATVLSVAEAAPDEGLYFRPFAAVGFNSKQGTGFLFGADIGSDWDENWSVGLTFHFSAGDQPNRDLEYGGGAYLGFTQLFSEVFVASAREEVDHLTLRNPTPGNSYETEQGIASITSVGITLLLSERISISAGYRLVLGLTNSDLGNGRSGPTLGLTVGI